MQIKLIKNRFLIILIRICSKRCQDKHIIRTDEAFVEIQKAVDVTSIIADKANGYNAIAEELEEKIGIFQL